MWAIYHGHTDMARVTVGGRETWHGRQLGVNHVQEKKPDRDNCSLTVGKSTTQRNDQTWMVSPRTLGDQEDGNGLSYVVEGNVEHTE